MVFHSLDKTTSLLIHITPAVITYILRWHNESVWDINNRWRDNICITDRFETGYNQDILNGCANWWNMVLWPFLFAVCQQIVYYFLMQMICYERIVNDPNALTTYRYLFPKHKQRGSLWNLMNICGKRGRIWIFDAFFIVYSTLSFLFTLIFYRYEWTQFVFIIICGVWSIKNGADFYGKVYTKKQRPK